MKKQPLGKSKIENALKELKKGYNNIHDPDDTAKTLLNKEDYETGKRWENTLLVAIQVLEQHVGLEPIQQRPEEGGLPMK